MPAGFPRSPGFSAAVLARFSTALLPLLFCASAQRPAEDQSVLQYLNRTVAWYRDMAALGRSATPKEALFGDGLRESSDLALRAAFQFARADASFPAAKGESGAATDEARSRNLMQAQAAAEQRIEQVQARIKELDREIETATAKLRAAIEARRGKLQGDLNLAKARAGSLRNLIGALNGPDSGLSGTIDDIERSVPELNAQKTTAAAAPANAHPAADEFHAESAGILGLTTELFTISGKRHAVDSLLRSTAELLNGNQGFRAPLRSALQEILRRGDTLAQLPDTSDTPELIAARKELDGLLERFRLLSGALAPLGQATSAFDASRADLAQWRSSLDQEFNGTLRYLLLRLALLALAIGVIFFFSELWRRATIRYVQDLRRRRQFLLLRRVVVGCTIAVFVVLSFVTEFGSFATFAGFSAAGIALAMQSVILSVVAYFFLVGRWGVRVGDRITVSGVTGDVVDIGLFRLYLMEVAGSGLDVHPTGRIVVFPNAVFFQPSAVFKQFPGLHYTWSTVSVKVLPDCDYQLLEDRVLGAVEPVYAEYRDDIERQHRAAQSSLDVHTALPRPEGSFRFTDGHLEFAVRFPVPIRRMAEVADRLTRELAAALDKEPRLKTAVGGAPRIQTAVSGSGKGD